MSDIYKPTYTIRNIADATAETLKGEGIGGLVFARAKGILTSAINTEWFSYAQSMRALGTQGIHFFLVADGTVSPDFFTHSGNKLDFDHIAQPANSRRPLRDGLAEMPHTVMTLSSTEPAVLEHMQVAVVGNWLSDIAEGNRADFPTILMPELLGTRGLRAVLTHPLEVAGRVARGLPFRATAFPDALAKDGCIIKATDDKTEEPAESTPEKA